MAIWVTYLKFGGCNLVGNADPGILLKVEYDFGRKDIPMFMAETVRTLEYHLPYGLCPSNVGDSPQKEHGFFSSFQGAW